MTNLLLDESEWMYQTLKHPPVSAEPACFSHFQMHIWCLNEHTRWWSNLFRTHYLSFTSPQGVVWILRFWFRQVSSWASLYGEQKSPYELVPIGTAFLRRWWWYHIWKSQCCKRGRWEYPKGIDAILNYMSAVDETSPEVPISQQWS